MQYEFLHKNSRPILFILLLLSPVIKAQKSSCCSTIEQVEDVLNGAWEYSKGDALYKTYLDFEKGKGITRIYAQVDNNQWKLIENSQCEIKVIEKNDAFYIVYDRLGLITFSLIKSLNATTFILERSDGKATKLTKYAGK